MSRSHRSQKAKDMNNNNYILHNDNPDGIDRRGFLKCMAWAGTGVLWTMSSGVLTSKLLGATTPLIGGDFSFAQISDSHIGFNKDANKDGLVAYPNVDMAIESVNMLEASRAYEANITMMETSKAMLNSSLRLLA